MAEIQKPIEVKKEEIKTTQPIKNENKAMAVKPKTITGKPTVQVPKPTIVTNTVPRGPVVGKNMEYYRNRDAKMVRGIFHHLESPGGSTTFDYIKYKGDTLTTYTFKDGEVRTIPLGVAKHINSCGYAEYEPLNAEMIKGATQEEPMRIVRKRPRFRFQNLDFLDMEEISELDGDSNKKIIAVESI
jgi:hypothetical protein